jgi:NAD(P)-dependent dehydrogenase (short-subunit alcohol dehydrogenase family)
MHNLENKIIIVTGGSGLLGKAIIEHIKQSYGTPINFDLTNNCDCDFLKVDITNQEEIETGVKTIVEKFGKIDGLVNNAYPRTQDWGIPFEDDHNLTSWRKNVDLQLNSYVASCQEIIKVMKVQQFGSIVNIASIYGVVGNDFTVYEGTDLKTAAPYSAIKGGLINFTRYIASYYGRYGIRANCVSPGGIFDKQNPIFVENYEKKVPMKRMGTPEDIAPGVSYMLSDGSQYVNGQNLIIDGGWTAI